MYIYICISFRRPSASTCQMLNEVYGDDDDQYWNRRLPFRLSLDISILAVGRVQGDSKIPSGNDEHSCEKSSFLMRKSSISMVIFNSYATNYQRVDDTTVLQHVAAMIANNTRKRGGQFDTPESHGERPSSSSLWGLHSMPIRC